MKIGRLLKQIRIYNRFTQSELCEKLTISPSHLSLVENGIKKPDLRMLKKYEEAFDIKTSIMLLFVENWEQRDSLKMKLKNILNNNALELLEWISKY